MVVLTKNEQTNWIFKSYRDISNLFSEINFSYADKHGEDVDMERMKYELDAKQLMQYEIEEVLTDKKMTIAALEEDHWQIKVHNGDHKSQYALLSYAFRYSDRVDEYYVSLDQHLKIIEERDGKELLLFTGDIRIKDE